MKIHDILEHEQIYEGPNDPNIFKAIFLAGSPGSGKSYVSQNLLIGTGLSTINSDLAYEFLAKKHKVDLGNPAEISSDKGQEIRDRAKEITKKREELWVDGRLGLIIDGTGREIGKVIDSKKDLNDLGYDTMMLFVNTSEEVAQERNASRPRTIPADMVTKMWKNTQNNIMKFQQVFGASRFLILDNSGGLEDAGRKENFDNVHKEIMKFLNTPPTKRAAKMWLTKNTKT
tara:strand:+ start:597 stop:1286 length:690 start_codon:yes stop_codon:yes gene_type:complete